MKTKWPKECPVFEDDGGAVIVGVGVTAGYIESHYPSTEYEAVIQELSMVLFREEDFFGYKPKTPAARAMLAIAKAGK